MEPWFPTFRRLIDREVPLPIFRRRAATRVQRHALLRLIAVSIEQNVSLIPLLESWAFDERGIQRIRLRRLAALLKSGRALPDAIEEVRGISRDEDVLALRFDTQMGTRTAAVRDLLNRPPAAVTNPVRQVRSDLILIASYIFIALLVIPFLHLKIVPVFQKILMEFSAAPPAALEWSIGAARLFVAFWWVIAIAGLIVGWCLVSTSTGRFIRHSVFDRWFRSFRELHAADVIRMLQIATAAGRPIPGVLSTLARYHFAPPVRHKLLFVRNEVEQGADIWQSMAATDLISPAELRLLKTSERVGDRSWTLGKVAALKTHRTQRRFEILGQFMLPALVLLLGFVVLSQALMIFIPLIRIIEGLL